MSVHKQLIPSDEVQALSFFHKVCAAIVDEALYVSTSAEKASSGQKISRVNSLLSEMTAHHQNIALKEPFGESHARALAKNTILRLLPRIEKGEF